MSEAHVKSYPQGIAALLALSAWVWTEFTDRSNPANRRRDAKAAGRLWACRRYLRGRTALGGVTGTRATDGDGAFAGPGATGTHPRRASTRRSVDVGLSPAFRRGVASLRCRVWGERCDGVEGRELAVRGKRLPGVRSRGSETNANCKLETRARRARLRLPARSLVRRRHARRSGGATRAPNSPALTGGREEARLACLAHDSRRSTGTIVFRLFVPATALVPDTAALIVSMPNHYKR